MIRHARGADRAGIAAVTIAAFAGPAEAALVERLRADGDSLFELVACEDDIVVGHIQFSRLFADRLGLYAALAPLCVDPARQRSGIGQRLVRAGLENAKEFGAHGLLVLGDPAYYGRFGFSAPAAAQVRAPYAGHPAFQALALEPDAFDQPLMVAYPGAFDGD